MINRFNLYIKQDTKKKDTKNSTEPDTKTNTKKKDTKNNTEPDTKNNTKPDTNDDTRASIKNKQKSIKKDTKVY